MAASLIIVPNFYVYLAVANPPTGTAVQAPPPAAAAAPAMVSTGIDAPTLALTLSPQIDHSRFTIDYTTYAPAPAQTMTLLLSVTPALGQPYTTTTTAKTSCTDFAKVSVAELSLGDKATLTITLATLAGVNYAQGTSDAFTVPQGIITPNPAGPSFPSDYTASPMAAVSIAMSPAAK